MLVLKMSALTVASHFMRANLPVAFDTTHSTIRSESERPFQFDKRPHPAQV